MKQISLFCIGIAISFSSVAQSSAAEHQHSFAKCCNGTNTSPSCKNFCEQFVSRFDAGTLKLKDGQINLKTENKLVPVGSDITTVDGTKITTQGTITKADGSTKILKEGDKVHISEGKIDRGF